MIAVKPACLWLVACVVRREIGVAKGGGGPPGPPVPGSASA